MNSAELDVDPKDILAPYGTPINKGCRLDAMLQEFNPVRIFVFKDDMYYLQGDPHGNKGLFGDEVYIGNNDFITRQVMKDRVIYHFYDTRHFGNN